MTTTQNEKRRSPLPYPSHRNHLFYFPFDSSPEEQKSPVSPRQQPAERGRSGPSRQSAVAGQSHSPQHMHGEASGSRNQLWVNGFPLKPSQEDQGEPSGMQEGRTPSQDLQPGRKGKEPRRLGASNEASTDRNDTRSESTEHSDEPASTAQDTPPELSPPSSWEITGNDGTEDSNQGRIEKLKKDHAEERTKRARLEERVVQLKAAVNRTREERRRWESDSSKQLHPKIC
ncbi:uncharacterized protein PAC_10690 [Phialocephala subalpina]|uniref:Uncharacterized protein n=1 Tax=Phialocephala subalpina TaxID=576137 RepID=A0A1L7X700_9HELO|nr:uncharacterized protein PAC_10690 [Phialocephala subalpina]